jgi:hypothetical protein
MKQVRKYMGMFLLASVLCLSASSCKEEEGETFRTFPAPAWDVTPAKYALQMTAVIELPSNLLPHAQDGDRLAAFAGNKCRGVGQAIEQGLYRIVIYGLVGEPPAIHLRYYSDQNKYLYQTAEPFIFEPGQTLGTDEQPEVPQFVVVTTDIEEKEDVFPTFDAPVWNVHSSQYSVNMTAILKLHPSLSEYAQAGDQLAAFAGEGENDCRGVGILTDGLFYITIHGTPDEAPNIHFRYYGAQYRYKYLTASLFPFETNRTYGTSDEPEIPLFSIVE